MANSYKTVSKVKCLSSRALIQLILIALATFLLMFSLTGAHPPNNAATKVSDAKTAPRTISISLTNKGDLLITDGGGKRLGHNFSEDKFVNEIPGAVARPGRNRFSSYRLPFSKPEQLYTINVSGNSLAGEVKASLIMVGPGFTVGFDGILLDPREKLTTKIRSDGRLLSFTASQDEETPMLSFAVDTKEMGYLFKISGMKISAGKTVTATLDTDKGQLSFADNDQDKDTYRVKMTRINADGTEQLYQHNDISFGAADTYLMDFGKWDGKAAMCFYVDEEDDGFGDESCLNKPGER